MFIKVFSSGESAKAEPTTSAFENDNDGNNAVRIAFLNMDTLKATFDYYGELNDQMEAEMESAQRQLETNQKGFQESYEYFQQNASGMNEEEIAMWQQDLMNTQQRLVSLQQQLEEQLMEKEGELLTNLKSEIDSVLVITKDELNLDFVFSYQPGSPLLFANDAFDITEGVVEKLNSWHPKIETDSEK